MAKKRGSQEAHHTESYGRALFLFPEYNLENIKETPCWPTLKFAAISWWLRRIYAAPKSNADTHYLPGMSAISIPTARSGNTWPRKVMASIFDVVSTALAR